MKKTPKHKIRSQQPDEVKYPWLSLLLDAYWLVDEANKNNLPAEIDRRGETIACHQGCCACCLRPAVPILEIEFAGISWYACEKLTDPIRGRVRQQLTDYKSSTQCPLLVDKQCSIYPMRPLACRHFYLFGSSCIDNDDPWETRQKDIWRDTSNTAFRASMVILPYYGIHDIKEKQEAFQDGIMVRLAQQMHHLNWRLIAKSMT
jgi:Fe-S-cluster containining protein